VAAKASSSASRQLWLKAKSQSESWPALSLQSASPWHLYKAAGGGGGWLARRLPLGGGGAETLMT